MNKKDYRIVFMGTPDIAKDVLEALINDDYNIVGVVAQPDKPVGRKKILQEVPTKVVAKIHNIPVFQPVKIKLDYEFMKELKPDVIITLAYGQIVPQGLLDIPTIGAINLHGSLLPKYRGAAPMQYALINGDKVTHRALRVEVVAEALLRVTSHDRPHVHVLAALHQRGVHRHLLLVPVPRLRLH